MSSHTTIKDWLSHTVRQFHEHALASARLDAELLLCFVLNKPRTYLHAHPEDILSDETLSRLSSLVSRRLNNEPIAYLTKSKEFYGRNFYVNHSVLIPRPESEAIIELLKKHIVADYHKIADVGTGSGCLAVTVAKEFSCLHVDAYDIDTKALAIAQRNAQSHDVSVSLYQNNLLEHTPQQYDIIVANLPYVDRSWQRDNRETFHEPSIALFASDKGLALIKKLIKQSRDTLAQNGLLVLEADPCQHADIILEAKNSHLSLLDIDGYGIAFIKS